MHHRIMMSLALIVLTASSTLSAVPAIAQAPDIQGVKLGMSETDAKNSLMAKDSAYVIERRESHYTYSDGVRSIETEPRLSTVKGTRRSDAVVAAFSMSPSSPSTVLRISRWLKLDQNEPPTLEQVVASLETRYGSAVKKQMVSGKYWMTWEEPGKARCWDFSGKVIAEPESATAQPPQREPSSCGYAIGAVIKGAFSQTTSGSIPPGQPASEVELDMIDYASFARDSKAVNAWISELRAAAVEKRKASGKAPEF